MGLGFRKKKDDCDATACHNARDLANAFAEIEKYDMLVKRVWILPSLWQALAKTMNQNGGKAVVGKRGMTDSLIWGARVHFHADGKLLIWDEKSVGRRCKR